MKKKYCIIVLFGLINFSIAQDLFPKLTLKLNNINLENGFNQIDEMVVNAIELHPKDALKYKLWQVKILDSLGFTNESIHVSKELISQKNKFTIKEFSFVFKQLGTVQMDSNLFEKAIEIFHNGIDFSLKYNDLKSVTSFQKSIGICYLKLEDNVTAENFLRQSLRNAKLIKDDLAIANACISLGNSLKDQGKIDESIIYYQKSLSIAINLNNLKLIAGNYNNLGNVMRHRKKLIEALQYFQKALKINQKSKNKLWESYNFNNIGNTYSDLKQYQKSIIFYQKSNKLKLELGDSLSMSSGYFGMSEAYSFLGDYKNAYLSFAKFYKLNTALNIEEQSKKLKELEAKYESSKKQAEIDFLTKDKELANSKNENLKINIQKNIKITILSIISALFLFVVVIVLFRLNISKKELNSVLSEKNNEIENSNEALQKALNELSIKNKEVIDSINYATYIQQASLPNISQQSSDKLRFELFFAPKDIVSGDFYFSYHQYQKSIFGVADCTGHGVPGAMVSLIGMNSIDKVVREEKHQSTATMVESLNMHVLDSLHRGEATIHDGMDISFCVIDHLTNQLSFTGANHNAYILRSKENILNVEENQIKMFFENFVLIELIGSRRPIGKTEVKAPFKEIQFQLIKTDRIILFTDGYADQIGGEGNKKLKKANLLKLLLETSELSIQEQIANAKLNFINWKNNEDQIDDVCLLGIEII
ncbi:MAG: tetratricopeptide repeat protein [Flavobacteriia bacterium]|nr:tetratricopeptide repeat protein [Flavobacteriia bacterium]